MYLKKLELFGFKSFANKTELVFEPGVTAVVGPNGCGKSNISDGIKWVLGEQSAKELRGSRMEDIVFNGTDDTQPVNLAEVSLTLSNKDHILPLDYDEVIITRRVFRSGESEYLLNKTPVRLKDIMQLLAGTGIGVSSYSIAEQGKMDRVLSARPEDRREIFEEASGITKYKSKKREALLKLDHTENNLTRLADIVNEVKRQIGSIERQARKAEKFRIEFDKLKDLDTKLAFHEYSGIQQKSSTTKQENEALRQKEAHFSLELNVQTDELRIHREKVTSFDEQLSEARVKSANISSTIDKNENTIKIDRERIDEISRRSGSLSREIEEIGRRSAELRQKINGVESEFNLIDSEKSSKETLVTESENNLNSITETIRQCEKAISDSKLSVMENAAGQSKLKNELSKVSAALNTASSRHRRLNIEKDNTANELESLAQKLNDAESMFVQQREIVERMLSELSSLRSEYEQLGNDAKERSALIEGLKQALASAGSKLEVLEELKEKKEGFSEGVKSYMEFIEQNPHARDSFIGVVAELLHPQEGFVRALECALGDKSQILVLKTKEAVREALGFLKSEKRGRAQFVAFDELMSQDRGPSDSLVSAGLSRLSDFVNAQEAHAPLLRYILKDTYLADSLDADYGMDRSSAVLVTKEGDLAEGLITSGGGSSSEEYTSIIGRGAKITELSKEVEDLNRDISVRSDEHSQILERLKQRQGDLAALEDAAKKEEIKLNSRESEKAKTLESKDKLQQELSLISLEQDEIAEEESGLKERESIHTKELETLESEHQRLESLIIESQNTIAAKSSEKENTIVTLTKLRTEMDLVSNKYDSQRAALDMLKSSQQDEESAFELRKGQTEESQNKSSSLSSEIERLTEENRVLTEQGQTTGEQLSRLQEERRAAYSVIEGVENKTRDRQKELDELRNSISTFHINLNELNYKASSIKERIQSAYSVDLDQESVVFEGNENWESISTEVEELKEKIEKMGPVNLVAIDEHKELQDRYDFLTNQQEDLLNAKESLHKAINKINRTTRKMFMETFEQIRAAFKEYFKLLFGGGAAELFLVDQSDILESGIEIVVRPPGKKLQSITLLSGGEKALTSVALLFSLFKVKPTPFCVLDEIDAPLDEANIDRFSRILQDFVKTTQFIIITHNKKTISISDVMYGITMERSGISKIVSVKLADNQKEPKAQEQKKEPEASPQPEEPKAQEAVQETSAATEPAAE